MQMQVSWPLESVKRKVRCGQVFQAPYIWRHTGVGTVAT
jgi:hypothetical protein